MRTKILLFLGPMVVVTGCDIVIDPSAFGPRDIGVGPVPTPIAQVDDEVAVGCVNMDLNNFEFGEGSVVWIDPALEIATDTTMVGMNPQAIGVLDDGNVAVVCTGDYGLTPGVVHVLDGPTHTTLGTIDIGGAPSAAAAGSGSMLYLGSYTEGGVAVVNCRNMTVERAWDEFAGFSAAALTARSDGHVVAVDFNQNLLIRTNEFGDITQEITVGDGPVRVALSSDNEDLAYVLHGLGETMGVANLATGTFAEYSAPTGRAPNHILWNESRLWIVSSASNLLEQRDPVTGAVLASYDVGANHNPMEAVIYNGKAFVSSFLTNTVTVLDL